ncbi:flavoprotein-like protein [Spinellus fusiger]|nr:flavoprotein-like protein [Spinellus fusiger]
MANSKVYIIIYSLYHHIYKLALSVQQGLEATGVEATIYQVEETLSDDILEKMNAPKRPDIPVISPAQLSEPDGIIFGIPTRFGMAPSQIKRLLDTSGKLWSTGALSGKFAGTFFSTASQSGGQETTALTTVTYFAHHGMIYVPFGYANVNLFNVDEVVGGSPYGAGTVTNGDGSRQPSAIELGIARNQGENFGKIVNTYLKGKHMNKPLTEEVSTHAPVVADPQSNELITSNIPMTTPIIAGFASSEPATGGVNNISPIILSPQSSEPATGSNHAISPVIDGSQESRSYAEETSANTPAVAVSHPGDSTTGEISSSDPVTTDLQSREPTAEDGLISAPLNSLIDNSDAKGISPILSTRHADESVQKPGQSRSIKFNTIPVAPGHEFSTSTYYNNELTTGSSTDLAASDYKPMGNGDMVSDGELNPSTSEYTPYGSKLANSSEATKNVPNVTEEKQETVTTRGHESNGLASEGISSSNLPTEPVADILVNPERNSGKLKNGIIVYG